MRRKKSVTRWRIDSVPLCDYPKLMLHTIDLHTHTTASDGSEAPADVIHAALQAQLEAVALTDHDTVAGLDEATTAAAGQPIELIRGCELSARTPIGEVHLLGLWLPQDIGAFEASLTQARTLRTARNHLIIEKLNALGVNITYDDVLAEAKGKAVGRPHIAAALVRCKAVPDERAAFERYLRASAPAFVPKEAFEAAEGTRLLADMGATVALAHPMLIRCPRFDMEALVVRLRDFGLDALEAYHSEHSQADEAYLTALAKRLGLGITGGSDFHGRSKPTVRLGTGKGGLRVPLSVLETLKERRVAQGLPL